jgi:hypothetical protein
VSELIAWKRSWYQPGESLWSVANKLAYAACASVQDVLRILAGVLDHCREGWLFPTTERAIAVCELLEVPLSDAKGALFADVRGLPSLQERERWQIGIRYCPRCIEGFVHRTAFQDLRLTHCLVHQVPLQAGCPKCKSALDPAGPSPWACSFCGYELVSPGAGWTRKFRDGPVLKPCAPAKPPAVAARPITLRSKVLQEWVAQVAYEEHSAIWSSLLGTHAGCTHKDFDVCNVDFMPARFTCPIAGAAWLSAKTFGIRPQFASGGFFLKNPCAGAGLDTAAFLATTLPAVDVDRQVRALVRMWTLDLLEAFAAAAAAGKSCADWDGGTWPLPDPDPPIYDRLATAAGQAAARCGFSAPNLLGTRKS